MIVQSAAIPYRYDADGELEILLVTSRKSWRWVFPKGHVRPGMGGHSSAAKEAFEEGGVIGRTEAEPVANYVWKKRSAPKDEVCRVTVYPMAVMTEAPVWPEMRQRERRWATISDALKLVETKKLRLAIAAFDRNFGPQQSKSPQGKID
jgi:8-oxo-dGTP pyrophosphatase MutT (NUDIX family)